MVRVTRDKLIDLARAESEMRGQTEDVISGYLIGSVANGEPLIEGTADIDLVLIHQFNPARSRELLPVSENIHFDITHHHSDLYTHPPDLRIHPWLGPSMCEPIFLYDPEHFFERAQAGVRGQFYQIDYFHARSIAFLDRARQFKLNMMHEVAWITSYTHSILEAFNALVTLGGFPVAGRRMVLILQERLNEMGLEEHFFSFQNLLGGDTLSRDHLLDWLIAWEETFIAAGYHSPMFNPARKNYFLHAFRYLIDSGSFTAILWNLITTWNQANEILRNAGESFPAETIWKDVLFKLKLSPEFMAPRAAELEAHLDNIEYIIENWL
jgi:hypothetical protein